LQPVAIVTGAGREIGAATARLLAAGRRLFRLTYRTKTMSSGCSIQLLWRVSSAVNVGGTMLCAREAVRRMSTRHGGDGGGIVDVSSAWRVKLPVNAFASMLSLQA
jgi:NAD(P)-dependent dehydrogenase (short-subunit alcohol dehydrogenase family)